MATLNKKDRIRLINVDHRLFTFGMFKNQEGTVISTRQLSTDYVPQVLVDFDGYTGHVSLNQNQVEVI